MSAKGEVVSHKGRKAMRLAAEPGADQVVRVSGPAFGDGTIEVDMTGEPGAGAGEAARGFVGLAFRVNEDASKYELFYLRPTNGRAEDQVRRNHSLQYVSHPDFPWPRLRKEFPEKYESYADLAPGEWTRVKITVKGDKARLYVNGVEQPSLMVNDLKLGAGAKGGIALWIGPGTLAHFSNLRVTTD
ncbi:MAG: family 16 glycoside hydrolase [Bryobacteraceae bacterium]|nr:family 16 glycoside hydrolase [Bryobacteraceae bacterium]